MGRVLWCLVCLTVLFGSFTALGQENLIRNGGFEQVGPDDQPSEWNLDYWKDTSTLGLSTAKVHGGKYALRIESRVSNDTRMAQSVPVEPNSYYKLSGWIAVEGVPSGKIGGNLSLLGTFEHTPSLDGTSDWRYVELCFKTSATHSDVGLAARLGMYFDDTPGVAYFDDLSMVRLDKAPAVFVELGASSGETNTAQNQAPASAPTPRTGTGWGLWGILILVVVLVLLANVFLYIKYKARGGSSSVTDKQDEPIEK